MTESTWEPEASLPQTLVMEYEAGITQDIQMDTLTSGGQTVHTLSTTRVQKSVESIPKRVKTDPAENTSDPSGYIYLICMHTILHNNIILVPNLTFSSFALPEEEDKIKCNTEKDSHSRRNHRTAG